MAETLNILSPGISAITDLGRCRGASVGQMTGGALDQYSAEVANTLVASDRSAALFELTALDFSATPTTDLLIAVTGAPADVRVAGIPVRQWEPVVVPAGASLTVSRIRRGLRVYIAVHGVIRTETLLGSCAPDSVLGFGRVLARDERVQVDVDCPPIRHPHFDIPLFDLGAPRPEFGDRWVVPVTDGPDVAEFGETAARLFDTDFVVGDASNHIGLRMSPLGDRLLPTRVATTEVLSRGVPIGAIEVPTGNELLVLHRGRGVTAGYPVLAVVTTTGLDRLGQARAGQRVRFTTVGVASAVDAHRTTARSLVDLRARVATVFTALGIPNHTPRSALTLESA